MIPGFSYSANYLNDNQVSQITQAIKEVTFRPINTPDSRQIACFGFNYDYQKRYLLPLPDSPIPKALEPEHFGLEEFGFNQLIINRYQGGQKINPHIDHASVFKNKGFEEYIACLSIGCETKLAFTKGSQRQSFVLQPNSLYVLRGEARYQWKHETTRVPKGQVRYSLTYRQVH